MHPALNKPWMINLGGGGLTTRPLVVPKRVRSGSVPSYVKGLWIRGQASKSSAQTHSECFG